MTDFEDTFNPDSGASLAYHVAPGPTCNAPLPFEPGPACARPIGHTGVHVTVGRLFTWKDDKED